MLFRKRNKYKSLHDEELLAVYKQQQSTEVLGEYYQRYGHLVMGTSMKYLKNKHEAEDLVMTLFEKLPKKLVSHDIKNFKSWLYMVTKNECLMLLRKKGILTTSITTELESKDELALKIEKESQFELLESAIDALKEEQRACITLFYIESKSYQEITELLQLDLKQVKSAIQNGKRNLKIQLEGKNEFKSVI
ncbi:MAG: sigma-70 family RNA polymerase sigma factor [Crocinitomicaceae bacterium]|nr:sigma-70 family RNA polymerase sigma factor [Crocinitomicaceae bacterium]